MCVDFARSQHTSYIFMLAQRWSFWFEFQWLSANLLLLTATNLVWSKWHVQSSTCGRNLQLKQPLMKHIGFNSGSPTKEKQQKLLEILVSTTQGNWHNPPIRVANGSGQQEGSTPWSQPLSDPFLKIGQIFPTRTPYGSARSDPY